MKRTIKFRTDINTRGCDFGYYKQVSNSRWYLDTISIAREHNAVIKQIKIHDWLSCETSKVVVQCNTEEQWREFAMHFLAHFGCYMKDIKVKL